MKIAIAADHGGYELKNRIADYLIELGHTVTDFGTNSADSVDYPDYAFLASKAVADNSHEFGILICGSGIGMSICANKVKGIRCALCSEPVSARLSRQHNDANILALGARIIGVEMAKAIVDAFLNEKFEGGRHEKRVSKIECCDINS